MTQTLTLLMYVYTDVYSNIRIHLVDLKMAPEGSLSEPRMDPA